MPDQKIAEKVYSKLLRLYPREFRERFGAEMQQNFVDLSRELEVSHRFKWMRAAWLFGDAIVQAGRENLVQIRRRNIMKEFLSSKRFAAVIGAATILPGVVMMTLLFLGIEPPLGPFREMLATPPEGPTVLGIGPIIAIGIIVVLPIAGILISGALRRDGKLLSDIGLSVLVGVLMAAPFAALQTTLGRASYSGFPVPVFAILWLLPALFAMVAAPAVRSVRGGEGLLSNPGILVTRLLFLILIGVFWAGIVSDQMPCFLGVPNCD